ncbi:MAG: undecaprenyl-diphosphate phosphatase [Candidatus Solibacter usitatus]|nr:undecaprenyl-diphosphate phosphatase [Candidatus Solibacter usitatus]
MDLYLLSIFLGIVEGLTEFLPVSSTAHLRVFEAVLGVDLKDGYWKMYTVVIQLGAILCLPLHFRGRIEGYFKTFPKGRFGDKTMVTHPLSLTLIAFACTAAPAFLLSKLIGKQLESLFVMGFSLIIGGLVMWLVDVLYGTRRMGKRVRGAKDGTGPDEMEQMTLPQAVWIGCCQTLSAVFPGTSRSMATIAAGQVAGLSRAGALEFSFLVSIPTMFAATGYEFLKALRGGSGFHMGAQEGVMLFIGFAVSFLVAHLVVKWFLAWVKRHGFVPFALYRIVAGAGVLLWAFSGRL